MGEMMDCEVLFRGGRGARLLAMLNYTSRCRILCLADQLMEYVRWYWTREEHFKGLFIFTSKRPFCIQVYRAKRHQGPQ